METEMNKWTVKKISSLRSDYTWALVDPSGHIADVYEDKADALQAAWCNNL